MSKDQVKKVIEIWLKESNNEPKLDTKILNYIGFCKVCKDKNCHCKPYTHTVYIEGFPHDIVIKPDPIFERFYGSDFK